MSEFKDGEIKFKTSEVFWREAKLKNRRIAIGTLYKFVCIKTGRKGIG